jgi:hypothetical protein
MITALAPVTKAVAPIDSFHPDSLGGALAVINDVQFR